MATVEGSDTFDPVANPVREILLIEATAAAASGWNNARKWLDIILQKMDMEIHAARQDKAQEQNSKLPRVQYALIVYGTKDRSTPAPVQCSAWTTQRTQLVTWLDGIQFVGGVSSKGTAMPQALAEAIVLSKSPYPGGAKPAAAAPSHPAVMPDTDVEIPVHTHLVIVCPALNPCRLPLVWPCAADTKARLYESKQYHSFLEKLGTANADKSNRVMYGLCSQLDFIKGSLHNITPGTVDIWDLIMALPRHRLSLSVISSSTKVSQRTCQELFAYGNYPISKMKAQIQQGVLCATSLSAGVYISPLFLEAQRVWRPIWQRMLEKRKQMQAHAQQQQQQAQAQGQGAQVASSLAQQQQQQPQHAPQLQQAAKQVTAAQQAAQHAMQPAAATQQATAGAQQAMQQANQQQQQAQQAAQQAVVQQQQAQQYKQQAAQMAQQAQQAQQQQQQSKAQQQQWQPGGAPPAAATPPTAATTAANIGAVGQAQQQRMVAPQVPGMPQQQQQQVQQQQQQQRFGMVPVGQAGMAVQPQQPAQQQQQQPAAGQAGVGLTGVNAAQPGLMQQQQPQQAPQQQPQANLVMLVQPGAGVPQMLVPQAGVAGWQQQQQQMLQQQHLLQQQQMLQQQQQLGAAGTQMAAAAAAVKQEKARVAFWSGPLVLNAPELGINQQLVAQVELSCSNPGALKQTWAQRKHLIAHKLMPLSDVRQVLNANKSQMTKVVYKVLQAGSMYGWLQSSVNSSPQKQVIMLLQLAANYQGVLFFGNQAMKGTVTGPINLNEGSLLLCGADS